MTVTELSQLYYLNREIELDRQRLKELEDLAGNPHAAGIAGVPRNSGASSPVERYAAEIVDLQAVIAARQVQCIHERKRLERYIADIPDSLTRAIFKARFVENLTWDQVAVRVGGGNSAGGVKKRCYRYLKSENAARKKRSEI